MVEPKFVSQRYKSDPTRQLIILSVAISILRNIQLDNINCYRAILKNISFEVLFFYYRAVSSRFILWHVFKAFCVSSKIFYIFDVTTKLNVIYEFMHYV